MTTAYRRSRLPRQESLPHPDDLMEHWPPDDDRGDLSCATGIVRALIWCLALYAVGVAAWLAVS